MAKIIGKSLLRAKEINEEYKLETDEAIKGGISWTISLQNGAYKVTRVTQEREIQVTFDNRRNEKDLDLIIKAEYVVANGSKRIVTKNAVLQGYKREEVTPVQPDTGNKSVVVNVIDTSKKETKEKGIVLKIHVYFDGTFANKNNIFAMEQARNRHLDEEKPDIHDDKYKIITEDGVVVDQARYEKDAEEYNKKVAAKKKDIQKDVGQPSLKGKVRDVVDSKNKVGRIGKAIGYYMGADPTSDMNSYTQVYTNIPIIFDMEETKKEKGKEAQDKEKTLKVYVEGMGTEDNKGDDFVALATGSDSGGVGIPSKVKRAFEEIENEAKFQNIKEYIISKVEVCVIGFSRGAATSRNFVGERSTMLSTLRKINKTITGDMVTYKFVGIFDTVCSVTDFSKCPKVREDTIGGSPLDTYITSLQKNNIKDYKLAMKDNVEEVVHLIAADEHRLFFPLTTIDTTLDAGRGFELALPGGHCDLGGGDPDIVEESYAELVMKGDKERSLAENYLLKNNWYPQTKPTDVTDLIDVPIYLSYGPIQGQTTIRKEVVVGKQYSLQRKVIVGYNRIPLAIMLHFAERFGKINLKEKDERDRTKIHEELVPLKDKFLEYAKNNHKHGRDVTPVKLFNREFNHLRVKYLHMSSVLDFVGKISADVSNILKIKDVVARLDSEGLPDRAIFSDSSDWDWVKRKGRELWGAGIEKIMNIIENK